LAQAIFLDDTNESDDLKCHLSFVAIHLRKTSFKADPFFSFKEINMRMQQTTFTRGWDGQLTISTSSNTPPMPRLSSPASDDDSPTKQVLRPPSPIKCRFKCGKSFAHASSESRHAKTCKFIIFERKNASRTRQMQTEILKLRAAVDTLENKLKWNTLQRTTARKD
jgi:hypothetical protein